MTIQERAAKILKKLEPDSRAVITQLLAEIELLELGAKLAEMNLHHCRTLLERIPILEQEVAAEYDRGYQDGEQGTYKPMHD